MPSEIFFKTLYSEEYRGDDGGAPSRLYHYTNLKSALAIVDSQCLHLTHTDCKSQAIEDAHIQFDIRTAFEDLDGNETQVIKTQPQWLDACYNALITKKSNLQLAIGIKFAHNRCSGIHTPEAEELCSKAWLGCKEFINQIMN